MEDKMILNEISNDKDASNLPARRYQVKNSLLNIENKKYLSKLFKSSSYLDCNEDKINKSKEENFLAKFSKSNLIRKELYKETGT